MLLPLFNRKSTAKQFLSLVISESTVAAALWSVSETAPKLLKTAAPVEWNSEAEASLVEASDVALENLGSQANTAKEVLLGLPETWAEHQSIAADKKQLIKKLTEQLNLKSVGFVITQEAIAALFRDREHTGCSALLVLVALKNVSLLVITQGSVRDSLSLARTASLTNDLVEGCARGGLSALPARILLASQDLSETELAAYEHELSAYVWDEKLFVHLPHVETVSAHLILEAVSVAGGREVAKALGVLKDEDEDEDEVVAKPSATFGFTPVEPPAIKTATDVLEAADETQLDLGIETAPASKRLITRVIAAIVVLCLVLGVGGALVYGAAQTMSRAIVAVVIKSEPVSLEATLTIDASAGQTDSAGNILKATLRTKQVTDSGQALTTGSKIIGDKATGSVTLYNRTAAGDKMFKAGTVLKLDSNVAFTLDSDTTVPVGTKDNGYVGKISAKVSAVNIGAASNIDAGTELAVAGFDKASFVATTDVATTGGASRTIQVVSDADQKQLADQMFAQLKNKALAAFNQETSPTEHVILSNNVTVTQKQFSDDIGKEVKSFALTMTVSATAIVYTNDDIAAFATAKLASQIPAGSMLKPDRTVIEVNSSQSVSDTKTLVNAKISAMLIPAFDTNQIAKVLAGKTVNDARAFLESQHAIGSYSLSFTPTFANKLMGRLPNQSSRIQVTTIID